MDISQIADEISSAISSAKQIEPFSKRNINLSTQEAYDVATIVRRNLGSPPVIGRKIGFTNRNIWSVYGVDEPIWGPITKNSISFFESNFLKIDLSQFC